MYPVILPEVIPFETLLIITGLVIGMTLIAAVLLLRRRAAGVSQSSVAHRAAQQREPPVEIGGTYEFGVIEFSYHHSGSLVAVGKVEGFVLFTEGVPQSLDEGDIIRAKVLSFNRGKTSATAQYIETV